MILWLIAVAGGVQSQQLENEFSFIELTVQIINLPELQGELQTNCLEGKPAIFIQADKKFIGLSREVFNKTSSPPYFIWHPKTLFFHQVDYWIKPTHVRIDENSAHYEFESCSQKKLPRKYFQGKIDFVKENGAWIVSNRKIKISKKAIINLYEKTTR